MKTCPCGAEGVCYEVDGRWWLYNREGKLLTALSFCPFCGRALLPDGSTGPEPGEMREALWTCVHALEVHRLAADAGEDYRCPTCEEAEAKARAALAGAEKGGEADAGD